MVGEEEWLALKQPLESGWLTHGPKVSEFEREFARLHLVRHALAVTSCTTGLHLILASLGIGPGDEVIVPAFTWVATANVVVHCGATPVFADVDPHTYNIDPVSAALLVTSRTRALIAVHLFGLCADIDGLRAVMPERVYLIEDAACAVGSSYKGLPAGGLGLAAAFSFHPRKVITTGEGGMVTTGDSDLAERAHQLRNHGASVSEEARHGGEKPYLLPEFDLAGFNYRMTDLQGAVGLVQLGRLEHLVAERRRWADFYRQELGDLDWLLLPVTPADCAPSWQSFVTVVSESAPLPRNELMERLHEAGISTRPGTHAVTELGHYQKHFPVTPGACPVACELADRSMALPLHNRMSSDDFAYVVEVLRGI
jgi:dTDP-4-amino-4,6-dideoxygalactose transaminase